MVDYRRTQTMSDERRLDLCGLSGVLSVCATGPDSPAAKAAAVSPILDPFADTVAIYFSGAMGVPYG
jgi:hypothetical protein